MLIPTLFLLATLLLLVATAKTSIEGTSSHSRVLLGVVGGVCLVFVLRAVFVVPSFVHANFHGSSLIETTLEFPAEPSHRDTYGRFGFLALGACSALFGRSFETIVWSNQCFGAAALGVLAWLVFRWTNTVWSIAFVFALGALHPALARMAASEDVHTLAMLLGLWGLLGLDRYVKDGSRWALVMATCALGLMVHTRQTLYLFAPFAYALMLGRGGFSVLRNPGFLASGMTVLLLLLLRIRATVASSSEQVTLLALPLLASNPKVFSFALQYHPLLDPRRLGPLFPLSMLAGVSWGVLHRGFARTLLVVFLVLFLLTVAFAFPLPGVEFSFRTPVLYVGLALAAYGSGLWTEKFAKNTAGKALAAVLLCLLLFAPRMGNDWSLLRRRSTDTEDYLFVRSQLSELAPDAVLVTLPRHEPMPSYAFPSGIFQRARRPLRIVRSDELRPEHFEHPVYFYAGAQCYALGLGEMLVRAGISLQSDPHRLAGILVPIFFERRDDPLLHPPAGMRAECVRLLAGARPLGSELVVNEGTQEPPFAVYGPGPLRFRFYRIPAAGF